MELEKRVGERRKKGMNWFVKWGVKRWIVSMANTAIAEYNADVAHAREIVARYIAKIELVLGFLKGLDACLADGKLTNDEADAIIDDAANLGREIVK